MSGVESPELVVESLLKLSLVVMMGAVTEGAPLSWPLEVVCVSLPE